jgi:nucleoside-diphosphate-sugar epimerase
MRMLITDVAGFLGSYHRGKFAEENRTVFCLNKSLSRNESNIKPLLGYQNSKLKKGNIGGFDTLERIICDSEVVFRLIVQIDVDISCIGPLVTHEINLKKGM